MNRRLPHARATPTLTGRGDDPYELPPCTGSDEHGKPHALLYDAVLDHARGIEHRRAVLAARLICDTCPIKTRERCLVDYAGEPGVIGGLTLAQRDHKAAPTVRPTCGKAHGANQHYRNGEHSCDPCKAFAAEAKRRNSAAYRARKKAAA